MRLFVSPRGIALLFMVFCLLLAACTAQRTDPTAVIQEAGGNTLRVVTDMQGNIVTDSVGDILKYREGEGGTAQSGFEKPPDVYRYNDRIVCDLFAFSIPKGWQQENTPQIRLTQTGTQVRLELQALHGRTLESFLEFAQAIFPRQDASGEAVPEPKVSDCSYLNLSGKKLELTYQSGEGELHYCAYALAHGEDLIAFYLSYPAQQKNPPDFDELISHMQVF